VTFLLIKLLLKELNPLHQSSFISIVGRPCRFHTCLFVFHLSLCSFQKSLTLTHLAGQLLFGLLFRTVNLSLVKFLFLVVLKHDGKLSLVLSQSVIFKGEIVHLLAVLVYMIYYSVVLHVDVQLGLETVIFFVQKVDLRLKFGQDLFVLVLLVLQRQSIAVLAALIKIAQSENLSVSHFNLFFKLFIFFFENLILLSQLFTAQTDFVGALISFAKFHSPLLVAIILVCVRRFLTLTSKIMLNWTVHFKVLGSPPNDVVRLASTVHAANYLVLAWHVQLRLNFVQFLTHS